MSDLCVVFPGALSQLHPARGAMATTAATLLVAGGVAPSSNIASDLDVKLLSAKTVAVFCRQKKTAVSRLRVRQT